MIFDLLIFSTLFISTTLGLLMRFSHFSIKVSSSINEIDFLRENEFLAIHKLSDFKSAFANPKILINCSLFIEAFNSLYMFPKLSFSYKL